jgi:DNA-binding GntR family transcriptional regulator
MRKLGHQHQNLDQKVYQTLKTMIIERELVPGTKIFQDKLARQLGVSRTPLVNALKKLEHEKLISAIPRRGFYVRLMTQEEMIQVFELREVLEGLAARRAAMQISDVQLKKLQQFFANIELSNDVESVKHYAEEDRQFHRFLVNLAEDELLSSILETYNILAFSYQVDRVAGLIRSPQQTLQEHLAIIEAIGRRDPQQAEEATRQHLANSTRQLRQELEQSLSDSTPQEEKI